MELFIRCIQSFLVCETIFCLLIYSSQNSSSLGGETGRQQRAGASLQLTNTPLINSDSNFISQSFVAILITKLNNFSNCQFNWIDVTRYRLRLCWCYRCLIRTLTVLSPSLNELCAMTELFSALDLLRISI